MLFLGVCLCVSVYVLCERKAKAEVDTVSYSGLRCAFSSLDLWIHASKLDVAVALLLVEP